MSVPILDTSGFGSILFDLLNEVYHRINEFDTQKREQIEPLIYYFAYGSLMNKVVLEEKIGKVKFVAKGRLEGFSLAFVKPKLRSVRATLIPSKGSYVEGAIYEIKKTQLDLLDDAKKTPCMTQKIRLNIDIKGSLIPVELHVFHFDCSLPYQYPTKTYIENMQTGAIDIEASENYLKRLAFYVAHSRKSKL